MGECDQGMNIYIENKQKEWQMLQFCQIPGGSCSSYVYTVHYSNQVTGQDIDFLCCKLRTIHLADFRGKQPHFSIQKSKMGNCNVTSLWIVHCTLHMYEYICEQNGIIFFWRGGGVPHARSLDVVMFGLSLPLPPPTVKSYTKSRKNKREVTKQTVQRKVFWSK